MAQYKEGTVDVTNASQVVTGTLTLWSGEISAGDMFIVVGDNVVYDVGSVDSDTQITLSANYAGDTAAAQSYAITRDFTPNFSIPVINKNDIETATVLKRSSEIIDSQLFIADADVESVFGRSGVVVAQLSDYDDFFLTPAEGDADYSQLGHNHSAGDITSGTLAVARGGTGVVTSTGTGNVVLSASPTFTGTVIAADINLADNDLIRPVLVDYGIKHATAVVDTNAATCTYSTAQSYFVDLEPASGTVTITISGGPVSGDYGEMNIRVEQDSEGSRTITWAGGVFKWPNGTEPTMTATADALDIFHFQTIDGGTTWEGSAIQDVK